MSFTWPLALLALLAVPLLLVAYVLQLRRKRRGAVVFSNVALLRAALPKRASWKRHVPVALFLVGLTGMGVAAARPQASALVPTTRTSIIMAMDVSRSMCATDVEPNRITVAQEAARSFIKSQPKGAKIGIVAFSGFAELVVPPTNDRDQLLAAVDGFTTGRGTAIGAAILKSLEALSTINRSIPPVDVTKLADDSASSFDPFSGAGGGFGGQGPTVSVPDTVTPPKEGYVPDIVVLLTDGANTRGIHPVDAAKLAADRRVRVYTIGFGTTNPTTMTCTAAQLGGDAFGQFGGGGGGFGGGGGGGFGGAGGGGFRRFLSIDEPTLRSVAKMTGAQFYRAKDAAQLKKVFGNLPKQVVRQKRDVELSAGFAGAGALLAASAMFLSLLWNRSP